MKFELISSRAFQGLILRMSKQLLIDCFNYFVRLYYIYLN